MEERDTDHIVEDSKEDDYDEGEVVTFKQKKAKFSRRTQEELALGFVIHLLLLFYWVFVHVYDATIVKGLTIETRQKIWSDYGSAIGRWKFLTYINMWVCLIYFFLAFFTDIMPRSPLKGMFQSFVDYVFTSLVFPLAVFVPITFWIIYAVNREFIYKSELDGLLPPVLNHLWHSFVLVTVVIELLLVYHPFPTMLRAVSGQFAYTMAYTFLSVYLRQSTGRWTYPFLDHIPAPAVPLFFAGCFVIVILFFVIGRALAYLRWGERIFATIKGEVKED